MKLDKKTKYEIAKKARCFLHKLHVCFNSLANAKQEDDQNWFQRNRLPKDRSDLRSVVEVKAFRLLCRCCPLMEPY